MLELKTLHIRPDDLPYIELEPGLEYRLLQVRPSEGLTVTQVSALPGASSTLHQHALLIARLLVVDCNTRSPCP